MKHKRLISLTFLSLLLSTASSCDSYKPESNIVTNIPNDDASLDDTDKDLDKSEDTDEDKDNTKNDKDLIKRALSSDFVYDLNITRNEVTLISATNSGITTLEIPSILSDGSKDYTITRIEDNAFNGLNNLTGVSIPDSVTYIGQKAFSNCPSLTNIEVSNLNKKYTSIDGVVYTKAVTEIVLCPNGRVESVTVPRTVNKVKAYAFANCGKLTAVYLPSNVTSILEGAFYNCSSLTEFTVPPSTTSIGSGAFSKSGITDIVLPKGLNSIGSWAFKDCTNLKEIVIPPNIKQIKSDTFYNCSSLNYVYLPISLITIGHNAFNGCASLDNITIPESVYSIGDYAFKNLKADSELNLLISEIPSSWSSEFNPDNLTVNLNYRYTDTFVSNGLIYKNITSDEVMVVGKEKNDVTTILIPPTVDGKKVTKIIDNCFYGENITKVTFGTTSDETGYLNYIGRFAFAHCANLSALDVSRSSIPITKLNEYTFSESPINSVTYAGNKFSNLEIIGEYAFDGAKNVYWGFFVTTTRYESYAFNNAGIVNPDNSSGSNVRENVTFSNTKKLSNLPSFLFNGCQYIKNLNFNNQVDFISPYAFENMDSFEKIYISNSASNYTTYLSCLYSRDYAKLLFIPANIKENIYFYSNTNDISYGAFDNVKSTDIKLNIETKNNTFYVKDSCLFMKKDDKTILLKCIDYTSSKIELSEKIDSIENSAFLGCNNIVNLILYGTECKEIGAYAFKDCTNLKYVTLPESLLSIGANAFEGCTSLLKPDLPSTLTFIPTGLFKDCSSLSVLNLPSSLTSIDDFAFSNCLALNKLTIPNSVVDISDDAFSGCDKLTSITIEENNTNYYFRDGALYVAGYDSSTLTYYPTRLIQILNSKRTSFVIPSTVTSISDSAFKKCTSLITLSVETGNTTYYINNNVLFERNDGNTTTTLVYAPSNITSLTLDKNVSYIKEGALDNTINLSRITVANDNQWFSSDSYCFYNKDKTVLLRALLNPSEVHIANTVEYITPGSFSYYLQDLNRLQYLEMPANLKYISDDELSSFNIIRLDNPNTYFVNNIRNKINVDNLTILSLNGNCKDIPTGAFKGLKKLETLWLMNGLETIGDEAFMDCAELKNYYIQAYMNGNLRSIGNAAFKNCRKLSRDLGTADGSSYSYSSDIINRVFELGESAFENCSSLTSTFIVPKTWLRIDVWSAIIVYNIKANTYKGCTSLKVANLNFPRMTAIEASAFEGCTNLTAVNLPDTIKRDGFSHDAFKGCTNLSSYNVISAPGISYAPTIEGSGISGLGQEVYSNDGVLYAKTTLSISSTYSELLKYPYAKSGSFAITSYSNVRTINPRAFENCTGLTSLVFESNKQYITTIPENTFKTCTKLTTVTLNHNNLVRDYRNVFDSSKITRVVLTRDITSIPNASFKDCTALTNITIPESTSFMLQTIGADAFSGCINLDINFTRNGLEALTTIGANAFLNCRTLGHFYIRKNLISIGDNAFKGCYSIDRINSNNTRFRSSTSASSWNPDGIRVTYNSFN